jgi:hypothetical protein
MWRSPAARVVLLAAALVAGLALGRAAAQGNPLPPAPNMPLVLGACIPCHSAEMVAQQRLDRPTWEVIVERMISYGAPITAETKPLILEYLVTHLRP